MLTIQQFRERFQTNEDCLKFLIEVKWGGGYQCPKCKCGFIDDVEPVCMMNQ